MTKRPSVRTEEYSLKDLLLVLLDAKYWIISAALLGSSVAATMAFFVIKPTYVSRATITPKTNRPTGAMEAMLSRAATLPGVSSFLGAPGGMNTETLQFQLVLNSQSLAEQVVDTLNLIPVLLKKPTPDADLNRTLAGAILKGRLKMEMEGATLYLFMKDFSPEQAQKVLTAYLDCLQVWLNKNVTTQSKNAEIFVKERLAEVSVDADLAETRLSDLRTGRAAPTKNRSLQSEMSRAERELFRYNQILDTLAQQSELTQIEAKRNDPMFLLIDKPSLPLEKSAPNERKLIVLGFVIGLVLSAGAAIALERIRVLFA